MQGVPRFFFIKTFNIVQRMKICSKFGKIVLVAMVNELHRTGGEELTFEKVSFLIDRHHFSTHIPTYVDWYLAVNHL